MAQKTITFSTGRLIINEKNISFHSNLVRVNNVNTISRENIGHQDKQKMRLLPKQEFVYIFRFFIIGTILSIVGFIFGLYSEHFIVLYIGLLFIFFASFLYFSWFWLDTMLGLKIGKPIFLSLFGVDAVRVVVQNIYGGNNLQFLVRQDEQSIIPKFETFKIEKIYSAENITKTETNEKGNLDDLERLAELLKKGIVTQEEFDLKKKKILGL
jgi:signal transduction histidine kinase